MDEIEMRNEHCLHCGMHWFHCECELKGLTTKSEPMKSGVELIAEERQEQIEKHGYDLAHDTGHVYGELAIVAAVLCCMGTDCKVVDPDGQFGSGDNPFGLESSLAGDTIHALKVAGALIAAEIDRLQS